MLEKIIVLEPSALLRESLVRLLSLGDFGVEIASAESVDDKVIASPQEGTVILISSVEKESYADMLAPIIEKASDMSCVVLMSRPDPYAVATVLGYGARGAISASAPSEMLIPVLALVANGGIYVPPEILEGIVGPTAANGGETATTGPGVIGSLNEKQKTVLDMVASGRSNRDIAEKLHMRENTVKAHVAQIMRKFNVRNRTELALMGCQYANAFACPRARMLAQQMATETA